MANQPGAGEEAAVAQGETRQGTGAGELNGMAVEPGIEPVEEMAAWVKTRRRSDVDHAVEEEQDGRVVPAERRNPGAQGEPGGELPVAQVRRGDHQERAATGGEQRYTHLEPGIAQLPCADAAGGGAADDGKGRQGAAEPVPGDPGIVPAADKGERQPRGPPRLSANAASRAASTALPVSENRAKPIPCIVADP